MSPAQRGPAVDGDDAATLVGSLVRDVPDFPQSGVVFKDITPVLADARAFAAAVSWLAHAFDDPVDAVVAIEARGFILGAPVAFARGAGLVPVRKVGKLPAATVSEGYTLEYGEATLEMHVDAMGRGDRVLVVDDVIATGGTVRATVELVRRCGASVVGVAALLEVAGLGGRERLAGVPLRVLLPAG
ncbi:MAG TPA: adenine phosphoribosyltransferase [Acidimicrobiales bacterium]|nr:adenine phosphoribosyltransferase [Acidimicrobiales bacterium]